MTDANVADDEMGESGGKSISEGTASIADLSVGQQVQATPYHPVLHPVIVELMSHIEIETAIPLHKCSTDMYSKKECRWVAKV